MSVLNVASILAEKIAAEVAEKNELSELKQKYDDLEKERELLQARYDELKQNYADLGKDIELLQDRYDNLMSQDGVTYNCCDICEVNHIYEGSGENCHNLCDCMDDWLYNVYICSCCKDMFETGHYDKNTIFKKRDRDKSFPHEHNDYDCDCLNECRDCKYCNIMLNSNISKSPLCEFCGINKSFTGKLETCDCIQEVFLWADSVHICLSCFNDPHLNCNKLLDHPRIDKYSTQIHHGLILDIDYYDPNDEGYDSNLCLCKCKCKFCSVFPLK